MSISISVIIEELSVSAGFIELTGVGELFPYCFKVYSNIEHYKGFDNNDNPTKRLLFTGTLSNGLFFFDLCEILTSKRPVKK